ncbi:acireductone synthase [Nocardioidaceae bacterium SCSIO 66511]|nr:acireductone synthase [Nocardioidaceae bacterium SCSIO 66511]
MRHVTGSNGRQLVAAAGVVLDIAGTMSPSAEFTRGPYSYARTRLINTVVRPEAELREVVADVVADVRRVVGRSEADVHEVAQVLERWSDEGRAVAPLSTLQNAICRRGFVSGELRGSVFPDVHGTLVRWQAAGVPLYVYSSWAAPVQQQWFSYSDEAGVASLFSGHFDSRTTGVKTQPAAYTRIAGVLNSPPENLVFLSAARGALDAASTAGWSTVGVRRPGEAQDDLGDHPGVTSFDELDLSVAPSY